MSSSSEPRLLRGAASADAVGVSMPDLRSGHWTRLGDTTVLGDAVTEQLLDTLAESTRQAARAQGYAVGWAEGRREAERAARAAAEAAAEQAAADVRRREAEHRDALAALQQAAALVRERLTEVCRAVDEQAAELALELTRELVGQTAANAGRHALQRVAELLPEHPVVRVRLHPDVAPTATGLLEQGVAVVADPTLGRADAVVEADTHVVDLRVTTALERLREVLS